MTPPAEHTLLFRIEPAGNGEPDDRKIQLFIDEAKDAVAEEIASLKLEGSIGYALVAILAGKATEGQLLAAGSALWERLRTGAIGAALEPLRNADGHLCIRLAMSPADAWYPWETMVDEYRKRLAAAPGYTVVRHPDRAVSLRAPRARRGPLSILTVVPGSTGLNIDSEIMAIQRAFEVSGIQVGKDPLRDRVSVGAWQRRLAAKIAADGAPYDIVHFIGHGLLSTDDGMPKLQLNDDAGTGIHEMGPAALAALFDGNAPRLVVLSACHSGAAAEAKGLVGFGQELMGAGVQAVVAMQQAIRNDHAIDFAVAFYGELAQSGNVHRAVTAGRVCLLQRMQADTAMAFSIPVLFAMPGAEVLFPPIATAQPAAPPIAPQIAPLAAPITVPDALVDSVLEGLCIPVLGPSLTTLWRGSAAPAWTPGSLALTLANKGHFPEQTVVKAMADLAERLDHMVLQRVCQHFEKIRKRARLVAEIKASIGAANTVSEIHQRLSTWPVPGFVCTHFDGLLTRAFQRTRRAFREVTSLDERGPAADDSTPLLVHLRGSIDDENSLCLTEADHDRLLDAMMRMDRTNAAVAGLVTSRAGTSLLLLGTTAWDPWLRHLLWRMIPRDSYDQNTLYIAQSKPSEADKAAWSGFAVEWIDAAPEDVVAAITDRVAVLPGART
jgi:hypothetical protein